MPAADSILNVYLRTIRAILADAERTLPRRECEALFDIVRRAVESQVRT